MLHLKVPLSVLSWWYSDHYDSIEISVVHKRIVVYD